MDIGNGSIVRLIRSRHVSQKKRHMASCEGADRLISQACSSETPLCRTLARGENLQLRCESGAEISGQLCGQLRELARTCSWEHMQSMIQTKCGWCLLRSEPWICVNPCEDAQRCEVEGEAFRALRSLDPAGQVINYVSHGSLAQCEEECRKDCGAATPRVAFPSNEFPHVRLLTSR
jgi:hypothetical protein